MALPRMPSTLSDTELARPGLTSRGDLQPLESQLPGTSAITCATLERRSAASRYASLKPGKYASATIRRDCRRIQRMHVRVSTGDSVVAMPTFSCTDNGVIPLGIAVDTVIAAQSTRKVMVIPTFPLVVTEKYYCTANSQLQTPCLVCNGVWEGVADLIPIMVTNPTALPATLRTGLVVARAYPQAQVISTVELPSEPPSRRGEKLSDIRSKGYRFSTPTQKVTQTGRQYTQDIRLTQTYLRQIEQRFHIEKRHFKETCYNGADVETQNWSGKQRLWVNPPWELAGTVVDKIRKEQPREFVLVLPIPADDEGWYQRLRDIPFPSERRWIVPRDASASLYELWYDGHPRSAQPLPWPKWDTMVIHGKRQDLQAYSRDQERFETVMPAVTAGVSVQAEWLQGIQIGDLTVQQRDELLEVLGQFPEVLRPGAIGCTSMSECVVPVKPDALPVVSRPYQYSLHEKTLIEKEVQEMLAKDVIEPSSAEWSAPVVLIRKKDGSVRFCVDYRKLNAITTTDSFPLPRLEETLDALAGSTVFSTMDLKSGYWQVPVKQEDRDKTTFVTHQGLYRWKRAPFGLKNMPAVFQRLMTRVLTGLTWSQVLVYIDDLIVYGKDWGEHLTRLSAVLQRLKTAGLTVNLAKCYFGMREVKHLGHVVSAKGVAPDPAKVQSVLAMKPPTNVKQVQQFLGVVNWFRKFLPHYSTTAAPLYALTHKDTEWKWDEKCDAAFAELKTALTQAPILVLPDPRQPFVLMTDASNYQIGAVVMQRLPGDTTLHPVLYMSKTLDKAQVNYATIEKECLALVWAVQENRRYLYGQRFVVITDHRPLQWLMTKAELTPKLMRWALILQEYDFQIVYGPGKDNVIADALSRLEIGQPLPTNEFKEIDVDTPVLVITRRRQGGDLASVGGYVGRKLLVPADWWTTAWARANKLLRKKLSATVVAYDPQLPDGKVFQICLPKGTTPDQVEDEFFYMTITAIRAYIVPEAEPSAVGRGVSGAAAEVASVEGRAEEQNEEADEVGVDDLTPLVPDVDPADPEVEVEELRRLQREDSGLQALIAQLQSADSALPGDATTEHDKFRVDREIPYLLDERGILMHVEAYTTTTRSAYRAQVVVPSTMREKVMYLYHASAVGAHLGVTRTYVAIREKYFWVRMQIDIRQYVLACHCQGLKRRGQENNFADTHLQSSWPNDLVVIDCAGPLPPSANSNTYLVIMQDCFTRYIEVAAVPRINAVTIAHTIFHNWIQRYGPMRRLLSDNGTEFDNELVVKGLCDLCGVDKVFTTAQHPQSNGMVERLVRTVKQMLVAQMDTLPGSWDERIPLIQFAYNNSLHSATGEVPFYLWYGRPPVALSSLMTVPETVTASTTVQEYRNQLWKRLIAAFDLVREHQKQEDSRSNGQRVARVRHDSWESGDLVWIHHSKVTNDFNSRKMYNPWRGPGQVLRVESPTRIVVLSPNRRNPRNVTTVHPDRLRRYVVPFCQEWQRSDRPFKFPRELLSRRVQRGVIQYRVRWLSVEPTVDSWEEAGKLPVHLTETYEARRRRASRGENEGSEPEDLLGEQEP